MKDTILVFIGCSFVSIIDSLPTMIILGVAALTGILYWIYREETKLDQADSETPIADQTAKDLGMEKWWN